MEEHPITEPVNGGRDGGSVCPLRLYPQAHVAPSPASVTESHSGLTLSQALRGRLEVHPTTSQIRSSWRLNSDSERVPQATGGGKCDGSNAEQGEGRSGVLGELL